MKRVLLLFIILLSGSLIIDAQIITTVAGGGNASGTDGIGDGLPATDASLGIFGGLAIDTAGNIYIADANNNRVRKVNAGTGIITTIAGTGTAGFSGDGGPAINAELSDPCWVTVDAHNNIYITDGGGYSTYNRIRKVDTAGIIQTIAGGTIGYTGDGGPATTAEFASQGTCIDAYGNIYISDCGNQRVRKIDTAGIVSTIAGSGPIGYSGDGGPATAAGLEGIYGICIDTFNNIYVADWTNNRVRKINITTGIITTVVGDSIESYSGDGLPATSTGLNPYGVTTNPLGELFIADWHNNRVRKVDAAGIITTVAGNGVQGFSGDGGPADSAEFYRPENVALDPCGNLYIADGVNKRVRKVTFNPGMPLVNTVSPTPGDTVCKGTIVTFTATATAGSIYAYMWLVNGTVVSTAGNTYSYKPENGDSVRFVLAGTLCNGSPDTVSSNTVNIVIAQPIVPVISVSGATTAPVGASVTLNATITNAGSSYDIKWYDNGILFNTTTVPTVTYIKAAGTDVITATVIPASAGCYDSTTSTPYTVTVNNEGISNVSAQGVSIYPNPAHDAITITAGNQIKSIALINLLGQTVYSEQYSSTKVQVGLENLPAGIYFVKVNEVFVQKVVKE